MLTVTSSPTNGAAGTATRENAGGDTSSSTASDTAASPREGPETGTTSTQTRWRPGRSNTAVVVNGPVSSRNRAPASARQRHS